MDVAKLVYQESEKKLYNIAQHKHNLQRAVITAFSAANTVEVNCRKTMELREYLIGQGYEFITINGSYLENDDAVNAAFFLVVAPYEEELFFELITALGKKYDQPVVLVGNGIKDYHFFYQNGVKETIGHRIKPKSLKTFFIKIYDRQFIIENTEIQESWSALKKARLDNLLSRRDKFIETGEGLIITKKKKNQ